MNMDSSRQVEVRDKRWHERVFPKFAKLLKKTLDFRGEDKTDVQRDILDQQTTFYLGYIIDSTSAERCNEVKPSIKAVYPGQEIPLSLRMIIEIADLQALLHRGLSVNRINNVIEAVQKIRAVTGGSDPFVQRVIDRYNAIYPARIMDAFSRAAIHNSETRQAPYWEIGK